MMTIKHLDSLPLEAGDDIVAMVLYRDYIVAVTRLGNLYTIYPERGR